MNWRGLGAGLHPSGAGGDEKGCGAGPRAFYLAPTMNCRFRFTLPLLAIIAAPAAAQNAPLVYSGPGSAPALISPSDPAESLSRYLRMLAANPRDLASLTGAGRAALAVGDPQAALAFFARAEEIAPRNARIKAGIASALVQMEQPRAALKLFDEALALGVPEAEIASDRGLAHDLRGENRKAQADYALALRGESDPEATRRLALSMAISGDRQGALTMLDPLVRQRDGSAERIRAFVLALTGDKAGAQRIADGAMPAAQAAAMGGFFTRLADLRPAQKALAVHFGRFPSDGRRYNEAELFADAVLATPPGQQRPAVRADTPLIPTGQPLGPPQRQPERTTVLADATAAPISRAPRRRPGTPANAANALKAPAQPAAAMLAAPVSATENRAPEKAAPAAGASVAARGGPAPLTAPTPRLTQTATGAMAAAATTTRPAAATAPVATSRPATITAPARPVLRATPNPDRLAALIGPPADLAEPATILPGPIPAAQPDAAAAKAKAEAEARAAAKAKADAKARADATAKAEAARLAATKPADKARPGSKADATAAKDAKAKTDRKDAKTAADKILADAKTKADKTKAEKARADAKATADAKIKADAKAKADAAAKAKAGPERYWVQVASGANKNDLGKVWARLKTEKPGDFSGRTPHTTPWRASNRLLVGPFKTDEEAQGFVNRLAKGGMSTIQFTSRAGVPVDRLATK